MAENNGRNPFSGIGRLQEETIQTPDTVDPQGYSDSPANVVSGQDAGAQPQKASAPSPDTEPQTPTTGPNGATLLLTHGGVPLGGPVPLPTARQQTATSVPRSSSIDPTAPQGRPTSARPATSRRDAKSMQPNPKGFAGLMHKAGSGLGAFTAGFVSANQDARAARPDAAPQPTQGDPRMPLPIGSAVPTPGQGVAVPAPSQLTPEEIKVREYINFAEGIPEKKPVWGEFGSSEKVRLFDERARRLEVLATEMELLRTASPDRISYQDASAYYDKGIEDVVTSIIDSRLPSQVTPAVRQAFVDLARRDSISYHSAHRNEVVEAALAAAGFRKEDEEVAPSLKHFLANNAHARLAGRGIAVGLGSVIEDPLLPREEVEPAALQEVFGSIGIAVHYFPLTGNHYVDGVPLGATLDAIRDEENIKPSTSLAEALAYKLPKKISNGSDAGRPINIADSLASSTYTREEIGRLCVGDLRARYMIGVDRSSQVERTVGGTVVYGTTYAHSFLVQTPAGHFLAGTTPEMVQSAGGQPRVVNRVEAVAIPIEMAGKVIAAMNKGDVIDTGDSRTLGVGTTAKSRGVVTSEHGTVHRWLANEAAVGVGREDYTPLGESLALTSEAVETEHGFVVSSRVISATPHDSRDS